MGRLSGGQLQRVYLARAIVRRPKLILLDEPVTGIDTLGEKDLYGLLERHRLDTGATLVMITHDWDVARYHASFVAGHTLFSCGHPETALCDDPTLFRMTVLSVMIGILSGALGLCRSFLLDVPSGSTLILSQVAMFALAAVFNRRARA